MNEETRDPQDVAASEAEAILIDWKANDRSWTKTIEGLKADADNSARRYEMALRLQVVFAADGGQLPLIPDAVSEPLKPRAKGRRMMHTEGVGDELFRCPKCQDTAPVPPGMTESARKRGVPCPRCNEVQP